VTGTPDRELGHQGKQVRDNMHARDLARAMWEFMQAPRAGEVYNIGGSRHSHCSLREAVTIIEEVLGRRLAWEYVDRPRHGDHVWWVSDVRKFRGHYPGFEYEYGIRGILEELCDVHGTGRSEG
jgi:CDP-paratose 2-epimerase